MCLVERQPASVRQSDQMHAVQPKFGEHFREPRCMVVAVADRRRLSAPTGIGDRVDGIDGVRGAERRDVCVPRGEETAIV